mgnify:CR=1 FL=1
MRTKLLFLFLLYVLNISATSYINKEQIHLQKKTQENINKRGSVNELKITAFLDNAIIWVGLDGSVKNVSISVVKLSTDEIIYSSVYSYFTQVELYLSSLLNEGDSYSLKITIDDTVYYGYFNY